MQALIQKMVRGLLSTSTSILSELRYGNRYRTRTTRRLVERRIPRYESSRQTEHRIADEWTEESISELVDDGYAQRLEKEEGYQRPRTSQLPVKSKRVFPTTERPRNLIPDPWYD